MRRPFVEATSADENTFFTRYSEDPELLQPVLPFLPAVHWLLIFRSIRLNYSCTSGDAIRRCIFKTLYSGRGGRDSWDCERETFPSVRRSPQNLPKQIHRGKRFLILAYVTGLAISSAASTTSVVPVIVHMCVCGCVCVCVCVWKPSSSIRR